MQRSLLKSSMCTSHRHELYICIYAHREHIDMDTHTPIHICMKIHFTGKPIKNRVSCNFVTSLFFSPHVFWSVGKLYSVVVGFPAILLSSVYVTSSHWKDFLLGWHLCLHAQILYVHIHVCPIATKKQFLKEIPWKFEDFHFHFFLCLEPVVL